MGKMKTIERKKKDRLKKSPTIYSNPLKISQISQKEVISHIEYKWSNNKTPIDLKNKYMCSKRSI